ncbi:MAG: RsmE family RNA methyltransferase [Firmicutes bacterium]|nr:RsmE family RNA methyltransferase [Bacillota bacterium]
MSRFFVAPENIGINHIIIDDRDDLHHMVKVLRLKEGDEIDVSDSIEWEYRAVIESLDKNEAQLKILDKQAFASEPELKVTLFQGVPKQGKMETIVQKCVELGVYEIVPVFMDRTVVVDKGNFSKKVQRWNKVSAEAVKQCKRGIIPEVAEAVKSKDMLNMLSDFDLVLLPYENEKGTTIKDVLRNIDKKIRSVAIIIGPEGGFSDNEADMIVSCGGESVTLGKTILRTETAGMAALSMVMYELEL